ncbi:GGDEF domain-containing protein [Desulfovibrio inopinatus]|uniref:GGDEF domain-containing protein n=1 Tax=Desulfovibrio inopinatus TaxID=102109 RepID=UPI000402A789|nr:diguanylate cyclase [Desulfovibrio inopinatus]
MSHVALVNSLAYRQAMTCVCVAFVIGTLLSATQVLFDWFQEKDRLETNIIQVMRTLEKPASQALYTVDRSLAGIVVDGLMEYKTVYRAALVDEFGDVYAVKETLPPAGLLRDVFMTISDANPEFSITLEYGVKKRNVGHMDVSLDIYSEMFDFFERALMTFFSGMFRNFALALCLIAAFNLTLVKPLKRLIADITMLKPGSEHRHVGIPEHHEKTELGILAENANRIFSLYEENAQSLRAVERELLNQKSMLEKTVEERTTELREINEKLSLMSQTDALTGLANRRCFDNTLQSEWARARRTGQPLSLAMIDVDHFKVFNDTYGHPEGDACLQTVARVLSEQIRRSGDLVARYGGEEFALILPSTSEADAILLGEKIRNTIESMEIPNVLTSWHVLTVSIGVAALNVTGDQDIQALLEAADQRLYEAKRKGRNCVEPAAA